MHIPSIHPEFTAIPSRSTDSASPLGAEIRRHPSSGGQELEEVFHRFVGQTFFGQLMKSMRQTVGKPAYFHGGRAEEVFQSELDQVLAEKMTQNTADSFSGPMFQLFQLNRVS